MHSTDSGEAKESERAKDEVFMRAALEEARKAGARGEVPVGAVIVLEERVIARAHNLRETAQDPTAHAELIAVRAAASRTGSFRLSEATCYVTLEPCPMCAGALINTRIGRVVYGADDEKAGALTSLFTLSDDSRLNHRFPFTKGILADESAELLSSFFASIRARRKEAKGR